MYDEELLGIAVACTLLFAVLCFFLILFVVRHKNKVRQHDMEKQRLLFELEKKELALGFHERELILDEVSQEIHDHIGQMAHLVRMNLHAIEQLATNAGQLEKIKYVAELTDLLIRDTRHIGNSLNSDFIKDRGLAGMLEYDAERINGTGLLSCSIDISDEGFTISEESQLLIYRIAEEAIHNVLQHAQATMLELQLAYHEKYFKMVIRDDGVGFEESAAMEKGKMGIRNMYQRAKLLNGVLNIRSLPGQGCSLVLTYPHQ